MKKVIKLTESDLVGIVKKIVNEQQVSFSEIKGTTSKEPIRSASVLTGAGLRADNNNFTGRWVLSGDKIGKTFREVKNLSLFDLLTDKSPKGGEDFIEFTVNRFTKTEFNPNKTVKTPSRMDESTPPKVESLSGAGLKVFNTYYDDETDPKYVWRMTKIVASGNGLLALSRALVESKTSFPNRITIGFSEATRTSTSYQFNAAVIGNLTSFLNGLNLMITAYILKLNNIDPSYVTGDPYVSRMYSRILPLSQEEFGTFITQTLYSLDMQFIPKNEIDEFRKKKDANGQSLLKNYNSAPIINLLKTIPKSSSLANAIYNRNPDMLNRTSSEYDTYTNLFSEEITRQYKERVYSFFSVAYGEEQAKKLVSGTQFRNGATIQLSKDIYNAVFGITRSKSGSTPQPQATQAKGGNVYNLGSSIPGQEPG